MPISIERVFLSLSVSTAALFLCTVAPGQQLLPDGRPVTLTGTVRLIHAYGPPGYGEDKNHDNHVSYWALVFTRPIHIACVPTAQSELIRECGSSRTINMYFKEDSSKRTQEKPPAKWNHRSVRVEGILHLADTMGEMTPIYIDAVSISATKALKHSPH